MQGALSQTAASAAAGGGCGSRGRHCTARARHSTGGSWFAVAAEKSGTGCGSGKRGGCSGCGSRRSNHRTAELRGGRSNPL
eukprot:NODE_18669_length_882_cov_2.913907.p3 GENE.NODE_18669_length_882_cov_2.913907~~NODE_18669_length_882_cov_2.913907.p3  ORF type:complete len:81 (+),score=19.30 NODE_18669_length_882_cov_2.913907:61-303(+)